MKNDLEKLHDLYKLSQSLNTMLVDSEWRMFKEWQRVIPDEPFESVAYNSIMKRAKKENIPTDNVFKSKLSK